ncbi:putative secreted protein (Por secretion system target) [Flavobacterium endophyticum]|uniref:Putative secreted protein (Por secretion system target) n=2 Tax=Flavobacterium endophyticum TaxID=1540163 RepID=A0A495MKN8_9FLAO|nr:putative secreted protein (Por secretion system target) [Flavobacterium endophyticum]
MKTFIENMKKNNLKILKKILFYILLLANANSFSQNLLLNPSFDGTYGINGEYAGCAPNYFYNPNWNGNPSSVINFSKSTSVSRTAPSSQKVVIQTISGYSYFAQEFMVKGERTLKASIWIKPEIVPTGSPKQKVDLIIRSDVPSFQHIVSKEFELENNNQWQKIEVVGNTNCLINGNNENKFYFFLNFKTSGTLYLDDASVTDETNLIDSTTNLISNPNFEGNYGTSGEFLGCASPYFFNPNWGVNPASDIVFSKDTDNSISGRACQKVVINSINEYCYFAQGLYVQPNRKLKASIWIKPTSNNFEVEFALRSRSLYNPFIANKIFNVVPNEWQKIEIFGDTKNLVSLSHSHNLDFFINFKSTGTVYLENASVTDITDLTLENIENGLENILKNGDFEYDYNNIGISQNYDYTVNWGGSTSVIFSEDNCSPYNGLSCQKITLSSKPSIFHYFQRFEAKGSKIYKASIWVKSPDNVEIDFTLRSTLLHTPRISSAKTLRVSDQWQKIEIIGGLGSNVDEDQVYSVDFFVDFRNTGTLYVDNASVVDVTDIIKQKNVSASTLGHAIPRSFFGMHINKLGSDEDVIHNPNAHQVWPPVNFGMLRMWDTGTKWSDLEPSDDQLNWDRLDLYVNKRNDNDPGCEIIYTLGMSPNWASNSTIPFADYIPSAYQSVSGNMLYQWEDYVQKIGERYNNKIKYWEIWNEVEVFFNQGNGNDNSGITLNKLAESAYTILKEINPNNIILSPNFTTSTGASDFLFKCNGNYYFDVFSFHKYTGANPESDIGIFFGYRNLLDNYGLNNIPIWNTEGSNTEGFDGPCASGDVACQKRRIGAVSRAYIVQWLYDVKNFNWYFWEPYISSTENWVNSGTTLSVSNSGTNSVLTIAGTAYAHLTDWLVGKSIQDKSIDHLGNWVVKIFNPSTNSSEYILWNEKNQANSYSINQDWGIGFKKDLYGNTEVVSTNTIMIDSAPILLLSELDQERNNSKVTKETPKETITVFPNPADNFLNVYSSQENSILEGNLFDLTGKLIIKNIQLNEGITTIDIKGIQKGVYILKAVNSQNVVFTKKVIIK